MKSITLISILILSITIILLIASCPNPINQGIYNNMKDEIGPEIVILSPVEDSYCANFVEVRGTVTDKSTKDGKAGKVKSLGYEVTGTTVQGMIPFESDGLFSFEFNTTALANTFTLNITAEDWNQNRTRKAISLRKLTNNNIPSFKAVPGDREITLTWDAIPKTESYDLYYTTNGSYPTENYGEATTDISSPFVLANLKNGNRHVFLLRANAVKGEDNWSGYEEVIPLSSRTLAPVVIGDYQKIIVEWHNIPGADEYEVWRATEEDGEYINLAGSYTQSIFMDTDVMDGQEYFYKIQLTEYNDLKSEANSTQTAMYPAYPEYLGSYPAWGNDMYDIFVRDDYAYIAHNYFGLHIYDISDPSAPQQKTWFSLAEPRGIAVSGDYAYVANGSTGELHIFYIYDPLTPIHEATCDTPGFAENVFVNGDYAYVADGLEGLQIVHIEDRKSPEIVASFGTPDNAMDIFVSGDHAYVADDGAGLQVIDISTLLNPQPAGSYDVADPNAFALGIDVSGDFAYVAFGIEGLQIIDISIPANPQPEGSYNTTGVAQSVTVSGNYAYVADSDEGMQVINIADPANPFLDCSFKTIGTCFKAEVVDNLAYIVEERGLFIVDLAKPFTINHVPIGQIPLTGVLSTAIRGEYAYLANQNAGLQIYDKAEFFVSSPSAAADIYLTDWYTTYVVLSKNYAYCANGGSGFAIVDITNPAEPEATSDWSCGTPGEVEKFFVRGEYAYIPDGNAGLQIIDVSDPVSPVIVGSVLTGGMSYDVFVTGDYAYIACDTKGLVVVDISNPLYPTIVGSCVTLDKAKRVYVRGNYAYVADDSEGLCIINITNPADPVIISSIDTPYYALGVFVSGYYVYVSDAGGGWHIINCSDPTAPMFYDSFPANGTALEIVIDKGYVYATDLTGVYIFELLPQ